MSSLKLMLRMLLKQNESLALKAFTGCDVMPRNEFVYVVASGLTGFSHCFLFVHASTVSSCRMLGSQERLLKTKKKNKKFFCMYRHLLFDLLYTILNFVQYCSGLVNGLDFSVL